MSKPTPPLSSLPLSQLQALINAENEHLTDRTPKDWFERAVRESELSVLAARKQRKEEMFLCYTKACQFYMNARMHPDFGSTKKGDANWAQRVKDFKETHEAYLGKAKELKEALKKRDIERDGAPTPSASSSSSTVKPSGPETTSMGSIADRMKALSGKGMDVGGSDRRMSKDVERPPVSAVGLSRTGAIQRPRATSTSKSAQDGNEGKTSPNEPGRSRSSSIKDSKPPTVVSNNRPLPTHEEHQPHASSSRPPPVIAPKPKLPIPPSQHTTPQPIEPSHTGSSTASTRVNINGHRPESGFITTSPITPHSGPAPPSTKSSKPPLPPIPQSNTGSKKGPETNGLDDFERTFPSLDDFGKQFPDSIPTPKSQPNGIPENEEESKYSFPEVPSSSFPELPSVPSSRPGLATPPGSPPTGFTGLKPPNGHGHDSPPNPDVDRETKRPSSQPNLSKLDGRVDPSIGLASPDHPAPTLQDFRTPQLPTPIMSPQATSPNGGTPQPAIAFPTPKPTPGRRSIPIPPHDTHSVPKPKFPFSNSVNCETLRSHFLNPDVEMVLLDVRSEEEHRRGVVGAEYEPKGAKLRVVWMDPTVLMRSDITSAKLEDSLSLSPEPQRRAFADRHKFDLVVVYDGKSSTWPPKGSQPSPLSRLWDIIYEHEFAKRLERNPVLLEGGFAAWREFIRMRVAKHQADGNLPRPKAKQANGYSSSALPNGTRPERSGSGGDKRAHRDAGVYQSSSYARNIADNMAPPSSYPSQAPSRSYATSPPTGSTHRPSNSLSAYNSPSIAPPPQASIHPGPGPRRQSGYVEHHNQSYSGYIPTSRQPIDYPTPHGLSHSHPQPPPPTAAHSLERYDARPNVPRSSSIRELALVANGEEVRYWGDVMLGLTGLKNFGSTCYMNSTVQCLSATYPFSQLFLDGSYKKAINIHNKLGTKGNLANAWSELLKALWREDYTFLSPVTFRTSIVKFASQFSATNEQHDSQEFLSFVLDGLHEDLNRVHIPPPPVEMTPERETALETLPPEVASEKEWAIYKQRNDSFIVDLFQGQYRNRLECMTCHKTSTTYDTFMYISLPITTGKNKVVIQELIDDFIASEIMDGDDKWNCPRCKVPRRATKTLTIARLPPIVIIQLKRFTTKNGVFWDKSENHVIFPMQGLDLTRYVPYRAKRGGEDMDDPRTQIGPFKYDLYGVSNHIGTLSSGHYTAFVKDAKGWKFAEDSRISKAQEKDIVSRQAYMLFYKRVRA